MIPVENIPTYLGGKCSCPGGCVRGISNETIIEPRKLRKEEVDLVAKIIENGRKTNEQGLKEYLDKHSSTPK